MDGWQPSKVQLEREAYRRRRTQRSWLIASVSSAAVLTVAIVAVGSSSGWPRTRDSFFDPRVGWDSLPDLLKALWLNLQIMLITEVLVLVLAALIAILRTLGASPRSIRRR